MTDQDSEFSTQFDQPGAHRRTSRVLRLLRSGDPAVFQNPELQQEFTRLFELLERIEEIAEEEYTPPQRETDLDPSINEYQPGPGGEIDFSNELLAFVPVEVTGTPETALPREPDPDPWHEPTRTHAEDPPQVAASERQPSYGRDNDEGEHLERWWINFNGDVSLKRLARLRQVLSDSPFMIEARFDEIAEGLIVLGVVTDRNLTMEQVDWLIRQVMDLVGIDRNAAILSRN